MISNLFLQVQRHQSQFGKAKDLLTRNYLSPTKFQDCTSKKHFIYVMRNSSDILFIELINCAYFIHMSLKYFLLNQIKLLALDIACCTYICGVI
jgi:hypothetical protein